MIDTDYNEESFFVRHCYFTGGNDPYKRLKTRSRLTSTRRHGTSLYRTVSRPFPKPETGKIAVKVINDYGDEVMKVFEVVTAGLARDRAEMTDLHPGRRPRRSPALTSRSRSSPAPARARHRSFRSESRRSCRFRASSRGTSSRSRSPRRRRRSSRTGSTRSSSRRASTGWG